MKYYFASFPSCPWTDVDDVVGIQHHVLIVLHNDDGIAQITEFLERIDESLVVALVESDTRLVKDIEHVDKLGTDLCGQTDALAFSSRE